MHPAPLVAHGFNYQSLTNLTQKNEIMQNKTDVQEANVGISTSKNRSRTIKTEKSSKKPNSFATRYSNHPRFISRQSSLETVSTKHSTPLPTSRSLGFLQDRIQKERKAHTMPPLPRISGPSSTPRAKLFASIIAPYTAEAFKSDHQTQDTSISYPKSDIEMTTDDDTPIIVTVQYDPETGGRPSEVAIRQAVEHQLNQRSNPINKKDPVVLNFLKPPIQPQLPIRFSQQQQVVYQPIPQRPSLRIATPTVQQLNSFLPSTVPQPSRALSSLPFVHRPPHSFLQNGNIRPKQAPKPFINRQQFQTIKLPRLPNRNISSAWGFDTFKPINNEMATQPTSAAIKDQQSLLKRPQTAPSSSEMFRPPAVSDIPELSKDNLLKMLNQIPDLQGRQFNIEYAPPSAPEGYPIPLNLDNSGNSYPEPVVIDKLPTNVIQHVKSSNNPALTAALEATIQQEQHVQSTGQSQANVSSLNAQPPTVIRHAANPHQQVQQSRPISSDDSDSSTETSSSETSSSSSSEETDSEESESVSSQNQYH